MFNRERLVDRVSGGAEFIAQQVGSRAQTIAERLRKPFQPIINRFDSYYEHLDFRGRSRLGYAKITATALGAGLVGACGSDALLPGHIWGWMIIWGVIPGSSVTTWASLELLNAVTDRIQSRHTPAT